MAASGSFGWPGEGVFLSTIFLAVFMIGFFVGHRLGANDAQAEKAIANDGRLTVSIPVHKDDASKMLGLLRELMEQVENDKAPAAPPTTEG